MISIKTLKAGNQYIIVNNITFLEQKGPGATVIHFTGGKSLEFNVSIDTLISLIEQAIV
jgi:hypothetical protein